MRLQTYGRSARYTRTLTRKKLVKAEEFDFRGEAMKRFFIAELAEDWLALWDPGVISGLFKVDDRVWHDPEPCPRGVSMSFEESYPIMFFTTKIGVQKMHVVSYGRIIPR